MIWHSTGELLQLTRARGNFRDELKDTGDACTMKTLFRLQGMCRRNAWEPSQSMVLAALVAR